MKVRPENTPICIKTLLKISQAYIRALSYVLSPPAHLFLLLLKGHVIHFIFFGQKPSLIVVVESLKTKCKGASFSLAWIHTDVAIKTLHNLLRYA